MGYIWSQRPVWIIALGFCAVVAANGIDDVALLVLATDTLQAGESAVGLLLGAVGIGLLVGYLLLTRTANRSMLRSPRRRVRRQQRPGTCSPAWRGPSRRRSQCS